MTNHPNRGRSENLIAIYQSGHAIFGIGKTLDQAIADANKWLETPITADDLRSDSIHGAMCKIAITPRLADAVQQHGGDIAMEQNDAGIYDLAGK